MQYSFYNSNELLDSEHLLWNSSIPSSRYNTGIYRIQNLSERLNWISYRDYFEAIVSTLEHDNFKILLSILMQQLGQLVSIISVKYISIFLEKHGALYHPSKLEVRTGEYSLFFVVNVAVSEEGKMTIGEEVNALNLLSSTVPLNFLPKVYAYSDNNPIKLPMFFGEWFLDFHEFHLSVNKKTQENEIVVWNLPQNKYSLSDEQTKQLYYQIAMIISLYYDPASTSRISSWHNASGDFVVNIGNSCLQTRLISVRKFRPMLISNDVKDKELSWDIILHAMMIFLLHISIHIRLDRLDGVGDLVLGNDNYVYCILNGFLQGLQLSSMNRGCPYGLTNIFKRYLLSYSSNDLLDLTIKVVNKIYKKRLSERSVFEPKLYEHVKHLYTNFQRLNVNC